MSLLAIAFAASAAQANVTELFAGCVGRLSAETEHAWLLGDPDAQLLSEQRQTFVSLLSAVMPRDAARQTLSYRIEVKMAHASLLTLATFGDNEDEATQAKTLAKSYVAACQRMLLDS